MLSRQFFAGVACGMRAGSILAAALVEQGIVTAQRRSPLMLLQIVSGVAALVLLWPMYKRSRVTEAHDRNGDPKG